MDRTKLMRLVDKIKAAGYSNETETVLTLEEYFDGNDERCSMICANTGNQPSAQSLREFFDAIRAKPSVRDVLVRVYDFEDALEFQDSWINSDAIYVITSSSIANVGEWFMPLAPSEIYEEKDLKPFNNLPPMPDSYRLIAVWWD